MKFGPKIGFKTVLFIYFGLMVFCIFGLSVIFVVLWFSIYVVLWIGSTGLARIWHAAKFSDENLSMKIISLKAAGWGWLGQRAYVALPIKIGKPWYFLLVFSIIKWLQLKFVRISSKSSLVLKRTLAYYSECF